MITVTGRSIVVPAAFTLGVTRPDATNTGQADIGLTTHTGDWVVTASNTTIEGYWIEGLVDLQGSNITFQNNIVVSRTITSYPGFDALVRSSGSGNVIQNNTLTQYNARTSTDNSVYYVVGVKMIGGSATVLRNDISNVNDCTYITAGTHQVHANYCHDLGFRTDDADQSGSSPADWSHNDGCQVMGGTSHDLRGNNFDMRYSLVTGMNSAPNPSPPPAVQSYPNCHGVILQGANNAITGVTVADNWFAYGAVGVRAAGGTYSGNTATMSGNRFTPDQCEQFSTWTQIRNDPNTSWTLTDDGTNVYSFDADTPSLWQGQPIKAPTTAGTTTVWQFNPSAHTP